MRASRLCASDTATASRGRVSSHTEKLIIFGGHSLGGACAILSACYFSESVSVDGIYTLGCPGLGRPSFLTAYRRSALYGRHLQLCDAEGSRSTHSTLAVPASRKVFLARFPMRIRIASPTMTCPPTTNSFRSSTMGFETRRKNFFLVLTQRLDMTSTDMDSPVEEAMPSVKETEMRRARCRGSKARDCFKWIASAALAGWT